MAVECQLQFFIKEPKYLHPRPWLPPTCSTYLRRGLLDQEIFYLQLFGVADEWDQKLAG
jgi:hypothetical protein